MRILQCINALTWGGAQTLLVDLCRFLTTAGHEVRVATFRDGPVGAVLRTVGVEVNVLGEVWFDAVAFGKLRRLVNRWRPAVVHSHLGRATFWARLAAMGENGPPLVTSVHGFEPDGFHRLECRMACRSQHIIFPSRFLADWYHASLRPLPPHRFSVLPPGASIQPLSGRKTQERRPPVIGVLARLHPVKGIDTLLEAAGRLRAEQVAFRLMIGGEGRDGDRLRAMADHLQLGPLTTWCGSVVHRAAFLEDLDVLVAPSREEAFGISICEAMERGVPVVATAVGGIPEIIRDGQDGRLVAANAPEALAATLRDLLHSPAKRCDLGEAGRRRIVTRFPRSRALERHLDLYMRLASGNGGKRVHVAVSSGELGGGERLALSLAQGLCDRDWKVSFTCGGEPLAARLRAAGAVGRTASMRAGGLFFGARLWCDVRRTGASVVHAHLNRAALVAGLIGNASRVRVVAHVHGLNRAIYYRLCHSLVAVSRAVATHLADQGIDRRRVALLPNCIPFPAMRIDRAPGPPWTIAVVAKLHANKGHAWALEAIETALLRLPPFRLWILGDGPERAALETRFGSGPLGPRLTFFGFHPDLDRLYPDIHLLLLPSMGEGIPLSLLEAMRWGIPCVATRVGGIPEIVIDGKNGLLVPHGDGNALRTALTRATTPAIWARMAQEGREQYALVNRFDRMLDRVEEIVSVQSHES